MGSQRLTWAGGLRFEGEDSRGFRFPVSGEEGSAGAKPSDLLPISLAACTAYDVVNVLRKQRQDLRGLEVRIDAEQEDRPPWRFLRIAMRFVVRGPVDPRKAERALALGLKDCSVHASIERCVPIEAAIEVAEA
ncbi:MAG TPA: OsmC family protein [Actinomycetota bacterium]|jgi:putative redox protein|nr:OsmC family protein [Actinomycetota bacterium]